MVIRKKLTTMIAAGLVLVLNDKVGLDLDEKTLEYLVFLVLAYLGSQGLADFQKHKAG